jgi:hypothetical protein
MKQVEFIICTSDGDQHSQGLVELETIPRPGESVIFDHLGNEEDRLFKVTDVIHLVVPSGPPVVLIASIQDK